jgi:prepilin-type N-terminal cleavage/methylation domain-containing protein
MNSDIDPRLAAKAGFTLVEGIVGIAVLGIGVACVVGALTKFNAFASTARNATGAYPVVMNQIDLIQSDSPFNPRKTNTNRGAEQMQFQLTSPSWSFPPLQKQFLASHFTWENF